MTTSLYLHIRRGILSKRVTQEPKCISEVSPVATSKPLSLSETFRELRCKFKLPKMELGSNSEEPASWDELYNINLMPSELFLKFRKEVQGIRVGLNMELYNAPINELQTKLVLKPLTPEWKWKLIYEPIHHDFRILSKKIPITKFLNLQVGVGHNFQMHATGWKWKLTTCLGGDGVSRIRNKTSVGLFPGFDLRFGWRADYVLPEITGALGTEEPLFNMQSGQLHASLDRIEAILTHTDAGAHGVAHSCDTEDVLPTDAA